MIEARDKQLECTKCGNAFLFSAKEAQSFLDKGLTNEPKKCLACRSAERAKKENKVRHEVSCATCETRFEVPFKPALAADGAPHRPLYCLEHFEQKATP